MYQEVYFNRGTEAGGGGVGKGELMWATRSAPPVILCLLRAWYFFSIINSVTDVHTPRYCYPDVILLLMNTRFACCPYKRFG